jgi:hypothetical protein
MVGQREIYVEANMLQPSQEGHICDYYGNDVKPTTVKSYSIHMRYINKSGQMAYSYLINQRISKWKKNLFFQPHDLTILNM